MILELGSATQTILFFNEASTIAKWLHVGGMTMSNVLAAYLVIFVYVKNGVGNLKVRIFLGMTKSHLEHYPKQWKTLKLHFVKVLHIIDAMNKNLTKYTIRCIHSMNNHWYFFDFIKIYNFYFTGVIVHHFSWNDLAKNILKKKKKKLKKIK